jgi:hypothetical protein
MSALGNGLSDAKHHNDALSVREVELSMKQRLGASEEAILITQGNLANSYQIVGQLEEALRLKRDVYFGRLKLNGEENRKTLQAANNLAYSLLYLPRFEEAKSLLRKTLPVAQRVLGESAELTLRMKWCYSIALHDDPGATLDDHREAVTTLEDTVRIARRVLGGAHPVVSNMEASLRKARARLRARATPPGGA